MTERLPVPPAGAGRRWVMLGVSMAGQAASSVFAQGAAFLIPVLHDHRHLSLAAAGVLVAMPTVGLVLTLIAWGALVDRVGERRVLVAGLTGPSCRWSWNAQAWVCVCACDGSSGWSCGCCSAPTRCSKPGRAIR